MLHVASEEHSPNLHRRLGLIAASCPSHTHTVVAPIQCLANANSLRSVISDVHPPATASFVGQSHSTSLFAKEPSLVSASCLKSAANTVIQVSRRKDVDI